MKNFNIFVLGTVLLIISSCTQKIDIEAEKAKVNKVLDQVIQVMETEDMDLLSDLFAHDPNMVCIGTDAGEWITGWEALKTVMQEQFAATENSKLAVKDRIIKVHDSGKVAWFAEIIDWNMISEGKKIKMEGLRGTGVLVKQNANWVVIQLHYSLPAGG